MDCITPSNLVMIPPGESIDIIKLLGRKDSILDLAIKPNEGEINYNRWEYTPRMPVMEELQKTVDILFLRAQSATDEEFGEIMKEIGKAAKEKQKRQIAPTAFTKNSTSLPRPLESTRTFRFLCRDPVLSYPYPKLASKPNVTLPKIVQ